MNREVSSLPCVHSVSNIRLSNTNVTSVLLYGSKTWKVTESVTRALQNFINRCLQRILAIWWPDRISNKDLWTEMDLLPIHIEIKWK
jgi:hypothetical protein